jgi:hypothetical protein
MKNGREFMKNIPEVKLGMIAVSRDCFLVEMSTRRRHAVAEAFGAGLYECPVVVENERLLIPTKPLPQKQRFPKTEK